MDWRDGRNGGEWDGPKGDMTGEVNAEEKNRHGNYLTGGNMRDGMHTKHDG